MTIFSLQALCWRALKFNKIIIIIIIIIIITDEKETAYLFQRISVAIQKGNRISFSGSFDQCENKWEPAQIRGF